VAGLVFVALQPAEAGWRHARGPYAAYQVGDGYYEYPAVGSYVDRYDHAAASSWGFRSEGYSYQKPYPPYYNGQLPTPAYRR
jgi:hypothetical protein